MNTETTPLPPWAAPHRLPPIRLRDGDGTLPEDDVRELIAILAKPRGRHRKLTKLRERCDPRSLGDFAWALFEAGGQGEKRWTLTALGTLGDDGVVRRLGPVIASWPSNLFQRAGLALEMLARIGTDLALLHVSTHARRGRTAGRRKRAQRLLDKAAAERGLTVEQLADRLVPDLGLDATGSMVLDYGPRRFTVGFDEQLRPFVLDGAGKLRKALPKPGVKDDAKLAPAAYQAFSALKKDVRKLAGEQIERLETAMACRRRWTIEEFSDLFVAHPLLWHVVRRLVWLDETAGTAFRVAEDRTFADVDDAVFVPGDSARIGIAHPLDLGDPAPWSEVFADYEILQPFPQLGRSVHALTEEERSTGQVTRFEKLPFPGGRVRAMERRGWTLGAPADAGIQSDLTRGPVTVWLDPGLVVWGDPGETQTLHEVTIGSRARDLDPVTASEILRDLTELTAPSD
ncbi:DUF4132 domain-containing protein [Spirillospora sp. NPDC047279]|uniref:DUF4132 domain-containing protein n=1 Tax=Spirillospora sp. NPDC047279 TaxID=3155478 RepID=UPI0033E5C6EB